MDDTLTRLALLLEAAGPWLLFVLAAAETSFITGLVVPAGIATALGAFLAAQGKISLVTVALFAAGGALVGDSVGFLVGWRGGARVLRGEGALGRLARRYAPRAAALYRRHPIYAVSFARLVPFVRTLMPMMGGMSRLTYSRFLAYDALGVAGWAAEYLLVGYLGGRSWNWLTSVIGTTGTLVFVVLGLLIWLRWRGGHAGEAEPGDDPGSVPPAPLDGPTPGRGRPC